MKRRQLFEFTDLAWWPEIFRSLLTDYLHTLIEKTQPFNRHVGLIAQAMRATGQSRVIDLCSGASGPWLHLTAQLRAACGHDIQVLLTDKFPNQSAQSNTDGIAGLKYYPQPVDAMAVPRELIGVRTLFNGLHHFAPEQAEAIIGDAVGQGQAIVVFELLQRRWRDVLLGTLLSPFVVLLVTPWVKPFKWSRIFLTYVVPVSLLVNVWDALVSELRCYTVVELEAMAQRAGGDRYRWHAGNYQNGIQSVTYLVGYPRAVE